MQTEYLTKTIAIDGVGRSRFNSRGDLIDRTDEGVARFWRWFQNSRAVDKDGRPLVVFHGTNAMAYSGDERIEVFHTHSRGGAYFSTSEKIANDYGEAVYAAYIKLDNPLIVYANGEGWSSISTSVKIEAAVTEKTREAKEEIRNQMDAILAELFDDEEPDAARPPEPVTLNKLSDMPGLGGGAVETDTIAKAARSLGYDGVIIRDVMDSPTSDVFYSRDVSDIVVATKAENIKSIEGCECWELGNPRFSGGSLYDGQAPFGP